MVSPSVERLTKALFIIKYCVLENSITKLP